MRSARPPAARVRRWKRKATALALSLAIVVMAFEAQSGDEHSEANQAAARVHARGGYPSTLPLHDTEAYGTEAVPSPGHQDPSPLQPTVPRPPTHGQPAWGTFVVVVLVVGLLLVLVAFLAQLAGRPSNRRPERPATPREHTPEPVSPAQETADDFAQLIAEGRFDEALALMFAKACEQLGNVVEVRDPSNTARELLSAIAPGDPRHRPFRTVVQRVERVHFAGCSASQDDVAVVQRALHDLRAVRLGP